MKQKFIVINIAVLIIFNSTLPFVSAQEWVNTTGTTNSWHQPEYNNFPDVESIGIGDFITGGFQPRSAFEINTNLYFGPNANPSYTNLEVFRTIAQKICQHIGACGAYKMETIRNMEAFTV
jgi:hypothetical protein